jgi:hypothetical protein
VAELAVPCVPVGVAAVLRADMVMKSREDGEK